MTTARAFDEDHAAAALGGARIIPNEEALRAEAAAIAARHPLLTVPRGRVDVHAGIFCESAVVRVRTIPDGGMYPLQVSFTNGLTGGGVLYCDAATALALFTALDDAVTACQGCHKALLSGDAGVCVVAQETLCDDCRRAHCHGTPHSGCNPSGTEL